MSKSIRGPQYGDDGPFLMHLERVCRLIEKGAEFVIEFNPCSDLPALLGETMEHVRLRIEEGGDVTVLARGGSEGYRLLGLTLANYKRLWRCGQNGTPTTDQRRRRPWV